MGNRFAIQGLGDEATHGRRDDKVRRTGSVWRPSDPELADERILTNTPKSSEAVSLYSGAQVVGPEAKSSEVKKYEDENSHGRLETKPGESRETKSREDAERRSASIAPQSLWDEGIEASGRTKPSSGYEDLHRKRSPGLYSPPDGSPYETTKTERTKASSCPKDQQTKNMTSSLPIRRKERKTLVFATSSDESEEEGFRSEGVTIMRTRSRQKRSENSSSR